VCCLNNNNNNNNNLIKIVPANNDIKRTGEKAVLGNAYVFGKVKKVKLSHYRPGQAFAVRVT